MNMKMQSVGFKADSKLEAFINQKFKKLEKLESTITGYDVILNVDKSSTKDNKIVEVKIKVPGSELFAKKKSTTFEEAADLVSEALRTQILKYKEVKANK
jgi:putative sigma-54 modulation protein